MSESSRKRRSVGEPRGLIERRNGKVWATEAGHILAGGADPREGGKEAMTDNTPITTEITA